MKVSKRKASVIALLLLTFVAIVLAATIIPAKVGIILVPVLFCFPLFMGVFTLISRWIKKLFISKESAYERVKVELASAKAEVKALKLNRKKKGAEVRHLESLVEAYQNEDFVNFDDLLK